MAYNVFRSDDTGAPTMNGTVGSIITVFDAILVNGFNTKTITITRTGTTATATCTSHGFRNFQNLTISGANESEYNGAFVISNVTANTFDYTVSGSPATPATGTISAKVTPLGWTKPYTGTNLAAYRPAAATSGAQFYLRVDHNTSATAFRLRGYETMSDVNTGTGPFPTIAQIAAPGLWGRSSNAGDSSARAWFSFGTEKAFYFFAYASTSGATLTPNSTTFDTSTSVTATYFGAVKSYLPGDVYNVICWGNSADNQGPFIGSPASFGSQSSGCFIARDYTLTSSKLLSNATFPHNNVAPGTNNAGNAQWPSLITGKVEFTHDSYHSEIDNASNYGLRCSTPGVAKLWSNGISSTRRYWDTFTDGTDTYLVFPAHDYTNSQGVCAVKLNGPHSSWNDL